MLFMLHARRVLVRFLSHRYVNQQLLWVRLSVNASLPEIINRLRRNIYKPKRRMDRTIQRLYDKSVTIESKCVFEIEKFQYYEIVKKITSVKILVFELDSEWSVEIIPNDSKGSSAFMFTINLNPSVIAVPSQYLKCRVYGTSSESTKLFERKLGYVEKGRICTSCYAMHTILAPFYSTEGSLTLTLHVEFEYTADAMLFHKQHSTEKSMLQLVDQLSDLLENETFSDFTFIVKGKTFKVHKNILANVSEIMRAMFTNELKESVEGQCRVDDIEPNVFQCMLRFIYAGILPANLEDVAMDLYKAAHYYGIVKLMQVCKEYIHLRLPDYNPLDVYELATMYDIEDLRMDAWKIVKSQCFKIFFPLNNEPLPLKDFLEIRDLTTKQDEFWSRHKRAGDGK